MWRYRLLLIAADVLAIALAAVAGLQLRFGAIKVEYGTLNYVAVGAAIAVGWLIALQYCGGYEIRHLASGPEETKRVLRASALTVSVLAIVCYAGRLPIARGFVIGVIPLGAALLLIARSLVRRVVARRRRRGEWVNLILAVGTTDSVRRLLVVTERAKDAGLKVVGACVEDAEVGTEIAPGVPVLGGVLTAGEHAAELDAGVVAVTDSGLGPTGVRELGWKLEGTGRGLVMAPALTEIAGTRMHISPVDGLPLVWLEQPHLGRIPKLIKRAIDITGGVVAIVVSSPLLFVSAFAVAVTSRGPILFRQRRLGVNGAEFAILKFRSMYVGADDDRGEVLELNDQDGGGVLFKIRRDPRITPVGRVLRRFSIDELPQLFQVVSGTMSLVGPRPLAAVDSVYTGSARRRLMVRPGLTGLWQVSGRSELSWDDALRLDLYYVENWSVGLDLSILARTAVAVLTRRGAY